MDMAVSIGNSNIRVAVKAENHTEVWRIPVNDFENVVPQIGERADRCIISSVKPELTNPVYDAVRPACRAEPIIVSLNSKFFLNYNDYEGLLGIDRVICCEAAFLRLKPPFIVVDLGTAATVNVVDSGKRFIGGLIFPGVQMGLSSLAVNTSQLPNVQLETAPNFIGRGTKECISSGAVHGMATLLDGLITRVWTELGAVGGTIITGGSAPIIIPAMKTECVYEENLIIKGMFAILDRED